MLNAVRNYVRMRRVQKFSCLNVELFLASMLKFIALYITGVSKHPAVSGPDTFNRRPERGAADSPYSLGRKSKHGGLAPDR